MDDRDFTKARSMLFPRQVLAGHDVIGTVPDSCRDFGLSGTALIVTGEKTMKVAGTAVQDGLLDHDYQVHMVNVGEANEQNLEKVEKAALECHADFLLGVGGGSKIDLAKMAATRMHKEFISVPTSASHDGIASGRASIRSDHGPISHEARVPLAVIADTGII
ncbi:MAG: iron-containing alcohol dehydrogenase, partial [Methanomassiliicoccales archaeon]|nr:iron-containing alcohol dehydrogenase [Methanomassiliicoccales archaeon]